MVNATPENWFRPSPGSLVGRVMARHTSHPDEIQAAVRVLEGDLPGESTRWRYRRSAIDPLVVDGVLTVVHGRVRLRLRLTGEATGGTGVQPGHLVWPATEVGSGARVEFATEPGAVTEVLDRG